MLLPRKSIVISIVFILALLSYAAKNHFPIPTGDAEDYWEFACGIELKSFDGYFPYAHWTGILPKTDGLYFYYYQEHHGRHTFKVSEESLVLMVPEVYSMLETEITTSVQQILRKGEMENKNGRRTECLEIKNEAKNNYKVFVESVNKNRSDVSNLKYGQKEIDSFLAQWEKSKVYWASIVFEAIFLSFWWLFTFHKGALGRLNKKVSYRIAFSPLLLFIPYYLGYAPYLFSYGPSGGILYPFFATLLAIPFGWVPYNSVEIYILERLPQPLTYISHVPASPMAISFRYAVSPTVLIGFACIVLVSGNIWYRHKSNVNR